MPTFGGCSASKGLWSAISVGTGVGNSCSGKDSGVMNGLETREVPENGHGRIRASLIKKVAGSIAQLKCLFTNAHSIGTKQEEWEAIVKQENYDTVAITET